MKYVLHDDDGRVVNTHIDFINNLNGEQYEVVSKGDGPCLVLAGAGSGKTRTLIYRLAYLIEKGVPPQNILLMTFTNKAAREMQDRAEMLLKYTPKGLWSGTFHHIGNRILRMYASEAGYKNDFGILDDQDSKDLVKACMKKQTAEFKQEKFPKPSIVQDIISFASNTNKTIEKVLSEKYPYFSRFSAEIGMIAKEYAKKKKESNNMDYDDLLLTWKWLLENVPHVKKRFTEQFRYIMVDEYQDTNAIQGDIIDLLASFHRNILVVGDDAQAIYSFRGAKVQNILSFPNRFKDAKIYKLETNYRSSPEILALANDSLQNNLDQYEKHLKPVNPPLVKPVIVEVKDLYGQAAFVVQRVLELRDEGMELKDMAILFRAHYQSAELEMELVKRGIPYVVRGGIRFFEQAHIKDILSYLKIMQNPSDEISWIRALTLCPGIGPGYAVRLYEHFKKCGTALNVFIRGDAVNMLPPKARSGFSRFVKIMTALMDEEKKDMPGEMISSVMDGGYETHMLTNFENAKDRIDDIKELINFSHDYKTLREFLNDITLRESFKGETIMGQGEDDDEELLLSTVHQAKGLEWGVVMVIGLCEGQFPHPKALDDSAEVEEERRLFYVASTRAKKYLYLIHPMTRFDYQLGTVISRKSRFLEELSFDTYDSWEVESPGRRFEDRVNPNRWDDDTKWREREDVIDL
ncbi:MAG TPA: ATP-dependent helicase [Candidatus Omnitrophota bacterium]|nr:ATP-dependent helicase [Candidatus Omnitrophota bacterium]